MQPSPAPGERVRKCVRAPGCSDRKVGAFPARAVSPASLLPAAPVTSPWFRPSRPAPCLSANSSPRLLSTAPRAFPHPHVPGAGWLPSPQRSGGICMALRVSGRWSDPSLPVAGPAHSASVSGALPAQSSFAASAGEAPGLRSELGSRDCEEAAPASGCAAHTVQRGRNAGVRSLPAPSAASQSQAGSCHHPTFVPVVAPPGNMSKAAGSAAAAATWGRATAATADARGQ